MLFLIDTLFLFWVLLYFDVFLPFVYLIHILCINKVK